MFKLEVGTIAESDDRITTAQHIGNSMATSQAAFIGDNPTLSAVANDVDMYRFDVQNAVTDFSVNIAPANGSQLDTYIRIFQADGTPYAAYSVHRQ